jgi:hypothetical protein
VLTPEQATQYRDLIASISNNVAAEMRGVVGQQQSQQSGGGGAALPPLPPPAAPQAALRPAGLDQYPAAVSGRYRSHHSVGDIR